MNEEIIKLGCEQLKLIQTAYELMIRYENIISAYNAISDKMDRLQEGMKNCEK